MTTLEEKVAEYKRDQAVLIPEELAKREKEVWDLAKVTDLPKEFDKHPRDRTLAKLLGEPSYTLYRRATLLGYGEVAKPLWARINERQMTITTGISLVQSAKHLAVDNGIELDVAVQSVIREYDRRPFIRYQEGVPTRIGHLRPRGSGPKKKRKAIRGKPKATESADTILVTKIRRDIMTYMAQRLKDVDQVLREQVIQETVVEIRILLRDFDSKVRRLAELYAAAAKADIAVTRRDVTEACHTLHMDPPDEGEPADMDAAKRQKKRLARLYHPDAHSGEDQALMREKFDAIMAAFDRLEQYNEKLKPTGKENGNNGDRSEGGGPRA